jgi:hypothetical protein
MKEKNKLAAAIVWIFAIIASGLFYYFLFYTGIKFFWVDKGEFVLANEGQFGDFIGGVIGTIFSAIGFVLLYLTLTEQRKSLIEQRNSLNEQRKAIEEQKKAFTKERFESKFFELIKLHRDNVSELKYIKYIDGEDKVFEQREVIKIIFEEFIECLREVRRYVKAIDLENIMSHKHRRTLQRIINAKSKKIDIVDLFTIDLAYCIIFFGVDEIGNILLRDNFGRKCNELFYTRLIKYMQLKSVSNKKIEFYNWKRLQKLNLISISDIVEEIYANRNIKSPTYFSRDAEALSYNLKTDKYYGGHQFRLGHYYRHLFQSYKYLNEEKELSKDEKYYYGKTFRAQLSTYEQALLFVNSVSSLGMSWEFTSKEPNKNLITKYNLIKNLPGKSFLGIGFKNYYPKVKYETDGH